MRFGWTGLPGLSLDFTCSQRWSLNSDFEDGSSATEVGLISFLSHVRYKAKMSRNAMEREEVLNRRMEKKVVTLQPNPRMSKVARVIQVASIPGPFALLSDLI